MSDPLLKLHSPDLFAEEIRLQWPPVRRRLLQWHRHHGRHDLPWISSDPYAVWISEIMLQQTQVKTVRRYFSAWMARWPTFLDLAQAKEEEVLKAWEGLGYYSRARNILRAAVVVAEKHQGQMPENRLERLALPGIGPSTASAIGAFAFHRREAIFDGNVRRVWGRLLADRLPASMTDRDYDRWLWSYAQAIMPPSRDKAPAWTQAIMDLGATICLPRAPLCVQCPLNRYCQANVSGDPVRWPRKRQKQDVKELRLPLMWHVHEHRLAVVRQPTPGIWAGLWSLPVGVTATPILASGQHRLSHRRVVWSISLASSKQLKTSPETLLWVTRNEWESKAWPRPLRAWWDQLSSNEKDKLWGSESA